MDSVVERTLDKPLGVWGKARFVRTCYSIGRHPAYREVVGGDYRLAKGCSLNTSM